MQLKQKISFIVGSFFVVFLGACTGGTLSSGAKLPQAAEDFGNNYVRVQVSHHCSQGRCKSFTAKFSNLTNEPVTILVSASRLQRAGVALLLERAGKDKGPLVIPPRSKVSETFVALLPENQRPMSWVMVDDVWCSLKVDSQCKDTTKIREAEGKCNGLARYYFESYVSTEGWITLKFVAKTSDGATDILESPKPGFMGAPPQLPLRKDSRAPFWGTSGSQGRVVFYKVECDAKCQCREVEKPRSFQVDDRFLPAEL